MLREYRNSFSGRILQLRLDIGYIPGQWKVWISCLMAK